MMKDNVVPPLVERKFDVLVTIDQGFEHEHNLKELSFGIVFVHVRKNRFEFVPAGSRDVSEGKAAATSPAFSSLPLLVPHLRRRECSILGTGLMKVRVSRLYCSGVRANHP